MPCCNNSMVMIFLDNKNTYDFSLCNHGLDLIVMGEKLSHDLTRDFTALDTSTDAGFLEYISLGAILKEEKGITFKKLTGKNAVIKQSDLIPVIVYVGTSSEGIVKEISLRMEQDVLKSKELLMEIYGPPGVEIQTEFKSGCNNVEYNSYSWTICDLEILLSGLANEIRFYFSKVG